MAKNEQTETENVKTGQLVEHEMEIRNLPRIDLNDYDAIEERINLYFSLCAARNIKPSVNGVSAALKIDRRTFYRWGVGELRSREPRINEIVTSTYAMLQSLWEDYMQHGKINPVTGIFLGKNHFEYHDQSEVVLRPEDPLGSVTEQKEIQEKYVKMLDVPTMEESESEEEPEEDEEF